MVIRSPSTGSASVVKLHSWHPASPSGALFILMKESPSPDRAMHLTRSKIRNVFRGVLGIVRMLLATPPPAPPCVPERDTKKGEWIDDTWILCIPALRYYLKTSKIRGETKGITPPPPCQTKVWSTSGESMLTAWCCRRTSSSGQLSIEPSEAWPWFWQSNTVRELLHM